MYKAHSKSASVGTEPLTLCSRFSGRFLLDFSLFKDFFMLDVAQNFSLTLLLYFYYIFCGCGLKTPAAPFERDFKSKRLPFDT